MEWQNGERMFTVTSSSKEKHVRPFSTYFSIFKLASRKWFGLSTNKMMMNIASDVRMLNKLNKGQFIIESSNKLKQSWKHNMVISKREKRSRCYRVIHLVWANHKRVQKNLWIQWTTVTNLTKVLVNQWNGKKLFQI